MKLKVKSVTDKTNQQTQQKSSRPSKAMHLYYMVCWYIPRVFTVNTAKVSPFFDDLLKEIKLSSSQFHVESRSKESGKGKSPSDEEDVKRIKG